MKQTYHTGINDRVYTSVKMYMYILILAGQQQDLRDSFFFLELSGHVVEVGEVFGS